MDRDNGINFFLTVYVMMYHMFDFSMLCEHQG